MTNNKLQMTNRARDKPRRVPRRASVICHLSWGFAQVRQLPPVAAGIDPDCAIATECDDFSGRQRCNLFDLPAFISSRIVGWGHAGSLRMTKDKSQEFEEY
jgi:hypothetical protein